MRWIDITDLKKPHAHLRSMCSGACRRLCVFARAILDTSAKRQSPQVHNDCRNFFRALPLQTPFCSIRLIRRFPESGATGGPWNSSSRLSNGPCARFPHGAARRTSAP